ncbi:hypothetical protein [Pedobacter sp. SYSU D00535]|uniref:hypothetical protein n=1 Tax=Pedobacter sp. SYSU D00535 TaxID=2810308 RepID=UPI001A96D294|nr:hypothetical protein [Pedobacter sp. SYSU D00535]
MEQENQGKITIQQGAKYGEAISWGPVLGEKEFLYFSEAEEAFQTISWQKAEEVCSQKLDESQAVLVRPYRKTADEEWNSSEEKILFIGR